MTDFEELKQIFLQLGIKFDWGTSTPHIVNERENVEPILDDLVILTIDGDNGFETTFYFDKDGKFIHHTITQIVIMYQSTL